jgi:alpha-1,3-rhamnosyl/mannosyltransferase
MLPMRNPEWYPPTHRWSFERSVRYHARRGALFITPTESVADDVVSMLQVSRDRVTATSEGVSTRFTGPVDPELAASVCHRYAVLNRVFFVAVGGLTPRKNLGVAFRALALLNDHPAAPRLLVVGGDAAYPEQTYELARASGAAERIVFTGRLPDEDLHALMTHAVAHIHPSMSEGFGLTTLEAMAAGTPCIASDAGALPEVVGDAGLLVDPQDAHAWANAMARVMDDDNERQRLRSMGTARVREFTWRSAAENTLGVYRRAIAQAQ